MAKKKAPSKKQQAVVADVDDTAATPTRHETDLARRGLAKLEEAYGPLPAPISLRKVQAKTGTVRVEEVAASSITPICSQADAEPYLVRLAREVIEAPRAPRVHVVPQKVKTPQLPPVEAAPEEPTPSADALAILAIVAAGVEALEAAILSGELSVPHLQTTTL